MHTLMRTVLLVAVIAFGAHVAHAQEAMPERDELNRLMPQVKPDPEQFKLAMMPGDATIRGVAQIRDRLKPGMSGLTIYLPSKKRRPVDSQPIYLLPYNSYTQAWIDLYMARGGTADVGGAPVRTVAVLDPSVQPHRRTITSNSMGDFQFRNVRPGRYVVYAEPKWGIDGDFRASRSAGGSYLGSYHTDRVDFAYSIVDVPSGAGVVNADIETQKVIYEKRTVTN